MHINHVCFDLGYNLRTAHEFVLIIIHKFLSDDLSYEIPRVFCCGSSFVA